MNNRKFKKVISHFYAILEKTENFVLMLLLVVMGLTLGMQVFFRYFLNNPLIWSEELARYLQVTITFLGIGFGIRHESHISMIIVHNMMNRKAQIITRIITNMLLIVCFAMFYYGASQFTSEQHMIRSSAMQVPMSLVYVCIPVSCVLYIIWTLQSVFIDIKKLNNKEERV